MNPLRENLSVRKGNAYERADTEMAAAVKGVRSGCDDCGVRYASGIQGISGPSGIGQTSQPRFPEIRDKDSGGDEFRRREH